MKRQRVCVILIAMLVFFAGHVSAQDQGFQSIFNGRDLTGWSGDKQYWSVQDGAITGITSEASPLPYNKFLFWDGELADFELRLKFRIEAGNSGVQYRSQKRDDLGEWVASGYQADIDSTMKFMGILYEEKGVGILATRGQQVTLTAPSAKNAKKKKLAPKVTSTVTDSLGDADQLVEGFDPKAWNEYLIIARGNHLIHKINGRTMVDVSDDHQEARADSGILALQIHRGPAMKVQFKDIQLKKLAAN